MNKKFTHNDKEFEIRHSEIDNEHCISVYQDNKQVSPTYSVSTEIESDYRNQEGKSMLEELEKTVKSDIERGLYIS